MITIVTVLPAKTMTIMMIVHELPSVVALGGSVAERDCDGVCEGVGVDESVAVGDGDKDADILGVRVRHAGNSGMQLVLPASLVWYLYTIK